MTTSCGSCKNLSFGGTYRLHIQGENSRVPLRCSEGVPRGERDKSLLQRSEFYLTSLSSTGSYLSQSTNSVPMVTDTTMEITLQEALFSVRRDVHPRCKPRGLRIFNPEDGGDVFLRNVVSYKNNTTLSYPRRQHSSFLPAWKPQI
jgi:hypothetical protein